MKRHLLIGTAAAAVAALVVGSAWAGGASATTAARAPGGTIAIHAVTAQENFVDADPAGFGLGDLVALHEHLTNAGGKPAGHDGVACTVTLVASDHAQLECLATLHLKGGDLTVQGLFTEPFREPHHPTAVMAVTGGTGTYAGATGTVAVHEVSEEETDYTFHLAS
jgi:hypothetical protein